MEEGEVPRFSQNVGKHKDQPMEECATLAIGVFEDDEESLHFPEEEDREVDEVQFRSGRQLPDSRPQPKNP